MEVDIGKRNKAQIVENVRRTVEEFQRQDSCQTKFGEPVVAFLSTTHPLFDTFFARGENDHPKNVYRPGNTLVVHYVPWAEEVCKSNAAGDAPSQEWKDADRDSLWLAMAINRVIRDTLDKVGRIHSNTSSMVDWDKEKHRYGWSNKIAGYVAGLGEFGPAGSLVVDGSRGGRVGSISTAALYADEVEELDAEELERIFTQVMKDCRFAGWGGEPCSEEMIAACPGKAITPEGIDREKCQAWCETIDRHTPAPEVCGKCFGVE
ncbi:MAG: hypothetical protein IJI20_03960 [Firmicutes bacterium]|nr:hypothetical protein [Bacillota bacterium]